MILGHLRQNYEFRRGILSMLRPTDIIALVTATGMEITSVERKKYMDPWRQLFFDLTWIEELRRHQCTATIIGSDFQRLCTAIESWDSSLDPTKLKLVLVITEIRLACVLGSITGQAILESIDATVAWYDEPDYAWLDPFSVDITADEAQVCVVCSVGDCSFDLHYSWCEALCTRGSPIGRYIIGPGKAYSPSNEVWETQWHCITAQRGLLSTKMHYVLEPHNIENYTLRLFVENEGSSCSLEKRANSGPVGVGLGTLNDLSIVTPGSTLSCATQL